MLQRQERSNGVRSCLLPRWCNRSTRAGSQLLKTPKLIAASAFLSSASGQFGSKTAKASRLHTLLALALVFAGATCHAISFPHISPAIHNDPHLLGDGLTTYHYDSEGRLESASNRRVRLKSFRGIPTPTKRAPKGSPVCLASAGVFV